VNALVFGGDGRLFSAAQDGTLRVWQFEFGLPLLTVPTGESVPRSLAVDRSGRRVAVGTESGRILLWNTADGP
jgi:hypothetical protein